MAASFSPSTAVGYEAEQWTLPRIDLRGGKGSAHCSCFDNMHYNIRAKQVMCCFMNDLILDQGRIGIDANTIVEENKI
jgi:hypothetical protein